MCLWGADYQLKEYIGTPGNPVQAALAMPHNGPEAVSAEINDRAIRELLARAAGVKNLQKTGEVQLIVNGNGNSRLAESPPVYAYSSYTLNYPTVEAKELFSERFQTQIKNYLRIRLIGHTRDFAVASVQSRLPTPALMRSSKITVLNVYKEVPDSWLKLWEVAGKPVGYYLVDGELAWTFRFMGKDINREVVDAQEFDPKLKDVFADARKRAQANIAARGVVPRLGPCHTYWAELKKVLHEDYKIRWWCPTDLNEAVYD